MSAVNTARTLSQPASVYCYLQETVQNIVLEQKGIGHVPYTLKMQKKFNVK